MTDVGLDPELSHAERELLLRLARASIEDAVLGQITARALAKGDPRSPGLNARRGVFVTLKDHTESPARLRGCIGTLSPDACLIDTVLDIAPKAAMSDPRFPPLEREELDRVRISLSVLTPARRLPDGDVDRIRIGRDGVQLQRGRARAVFLPQVATEQGWTVRQLLSNLARKAGLPDDGWTDAELSTFRAEAFGEPDQGENSRKY